MSIRATITASNVYNQYGILLVVGTTYTLDDDFGKSLIQSQKATDTDSIFSSIAVQKGYHDAFTLQSSAPEAFTASRSLTEVDNGKTLVSPSAATTLTVPTGLPSNFAVAVQQSGSGQVTFTAATGVTVNNVNTQTKTSGQYAVVTLGQVSSNVYVLSGSTGA